MGAGYRRCLADTGRRPHRQRFAWRPSQPGGRRAAVQYRLVAHTSSRPAQVKAATDFLRTHPNP